MVQAVGDALGSIAFANGVRTVILVIGFTLASACVKFAWLAFRGTEPYRAWGLLSYGAFLITPALSGLYRYDQPLRWVTTITYLAGLVFGLLSLRATYDLLPSWAHRRPHDQER